MGSFLTTCPPWVFAQLRKLPPESSSEKSLFFSSRRRHTRLQGVWSSDVCSSDLGTKWRRRNPACSKALESTHEPSRFLSSGWRRGRCLLCGGRSGRHADHRPRDRFAALSSRQTLCRCDSQLWDGSGRRSPALAHGCWNYREE